MRSYRFRSRPGVVLVCSALVMGSVAACGEDDDPTGSPTTTLPSTAPPTTPTTLSAQEVDEQALRQLAEDWFEAVRRIFVDGEDPSLAEQYITGQYLEEFRQQVADHATNGQTGKRDPHDRTRTEIEQISIAGDTAIVIECVTNADLLLDAETGAVIDDSVGVRRYETQAIRVADSWQFAKRTSIPTSDGSTTCAA